MTLLAVHTHTHTHTAHSLLVTLSERSSNAGGLFDACWDGWGVQSLCWGSYFLAHCVAAYAGGLLQKFFGSRVLYGSVSVTCLFVFWPALRGWLKVGNALSINIALFQVLS
jgi:hypothetical protein